jgi:hypothetical protein
MLKSITIITELLSMVLHLSNSEDLLMNCKVGNPDLIFNVTCIIHLDMKQDTFLGTSTPFHNSIMLCCT